MYFLHFLRFVFYLYCTQGSRRRGQEMLFDESSAISLPSPRFSIDGEKVVFKLMPKLTTNLRCAKINDVVSLFPLVNLRNYRAGALATEIAYDQGNLRYTLIYRQLAPIIVVVSLKGYISERTLYQHVQ